MKDKSSGNWYNCIVQRVGREISGRTGYWNGCMDCLGIAQMEILIFNLWGNMLFRTNDLKTEGWDGKANGELMPGGNYVYRIKMVSIDGEAVEQSGRFLLIR